MLMVTLTGTLIAKGQEESAKCLNHEQPLLPQQNMLAFNSPALAAFELSARLIGN